MASLDLLSRTPLISSLGISLLVCLSVLGLRNLGNLESLELAAYDRFIRSRPSLRSQRPHCAGWHDGTRY